MVQIDCDRKTRFKGYKWFKSNVYAKTDFIDTFPGYVAASAIFFTRVYLPRSYWTPFISASLQIKFSR